MFLQARSSLDKNRAIRFLFLVFSMPCAQLAWPHCRIPLKHSPVLHLPSVWWLLQRLASPPVLPGQHSCAGQSGNLDGKGQQKLRGLFVLLCSVQTLLLCGRSPVAPSLREALWVAERRRRQVLSSGISQQS